MVRYIQENLIFEYIDYYLSTMHEKFSDRNNGWKTKFLYNPHIFENTNFFLTSLEIIKNQKTVVKFNFIRAYNNYYNHIVNISNSSDNRKPFDFFVNYLSDIEVILGRELIAANGRRVDLDSSFNKSDYNKLPVNNLKAFEFAPIIEDWIELCLNFYNEFNVNQTQNLEIENALSLNQFKQKYYPEFEKKRNVIISDFILSGRLNGINVDW